MKAYRVFLAALMPLCLLTGSSCSGAFSAMDIVVAAPDLPAAWSGADGWELIIVSGEDEGEAVRMAPGGCLVASLPRGSGAVALCRAVFGEHRSLPYGAVWPVDRNEDGMLRPTAVGGYSASLAMVLLRYGTLAFDVDRFESEALARLSDPWDVDPASLAPAMAERRFRVDHLNQPDRFPVLVSGLPRALAPDSPWGQPVTPDESGAATVELAPGVRRWMGGGYELTVSVSDDGKAYWTLAEP